MLHTLPHHNHLKSIENSNLGYFHLNNQDISIQITDLNGKIIYNQLVKNSLEFNKKISLDQVNSSVYLLQIKIGKDLFIKKLLIQK